MARAKLTNNAISTLSAAITTNTQTAITLVDASKFPSLSGGEYFYATIADATNKEIVKVTARTGNNLTIVRGQDGTTAQSSFAIGSAVSLNLVAVVINELVPADGSGATGTWNISVSGSAASASTAAALSAVNSIALGGTGASNSGQALVNLGERTGTTGTLSVPAGTTAQRDTSLGVGIRYNSTLVTFEGYNGSTWGTVGGGATGGGTDKIFWKNDQTINTDYTIGATENAGTWGPVTIANGVTVTVNNGGTWTVA